MRRSITGPVLLALAGAGLSVPTAAASTQATASVWDGGSTVSYTAGDETNDVVIVQGPAGRAEFIIDDQVPIAAGDGCTHPEADDPTYVVCTRALSPGDASTYVTVDLGGGNDQLTLRAGDEGSQVTGGEGDDLMDGTAGHWFSGGYGNDTIRDAGVAYGGPGDDVLAPGSLGEGGDGNDTLIGGSLSDALYGGSGDDLLLCGDGMDYASGEAGRDEIRGGRGPDELHGGEDADTVYGNSGDDLLYGGPGADRLSGGPGTDTIHHD